MRNEEKVYYVEEDLIEIAGEDPLKRLAEEGNTVYLDIENIERRADNSKDKFQDQFQEALRFIYSGNSQIHEQTVQVPTGGNISWAETKNLDTITHITRKEGKRSALKRKNIKSDYPRFLQYGEDILDQGLIDVQWCDDPKKLTLEDLCNQTGQEFQHNQIIRINDGDDLLHKVQYPLNQVKEGRFRLEEEGGRLENFSANHTRAITGFKPRNLEQKIGIQFCQDKNIELQIIAGGSGSGKTVLAYAAAINLILSDKKGKAQYDGIKVFKSNDIIGGEDRDPGFLKGTAFEKHAPFIQSYIDAHELLGFGSQKDGIRFSELLADPNFDDPEFGRRQKDTMLGLYLPQNNKAIEVTHLNYSRGRTFEKNVVLVDEAQNYTPFEIKQLVERVGQDSKIFLIGDPEQIDNSKLSKNFNGLVYAAGLFFGTHPRFAITKLNETYRSQSAEIARDHKAPKI